MTNNPITNKNNKFSIFNFTIFNEILMTKILKYEICQNPKSQIPNNA
jgi:hypothetical protein